MRRRDWTMNTFEGCNFRARQKKQSQNALFSPFLCTVVSKKIIIFLICKPLALIPKVYDNILPAKPPSEIWEHGHITTIESSRATNTSNQTIKHVVNKHVAVSPEVNWGWWWNSYCGRQECWPKTAEISPTVEGGGVRFPIIGIKLNHRADYEVFKPRIYSVLQWLHDTVGPRFRTSSSGSSALLSNVWTAPSG